MGRIVVNKHLDNKENITRELFHENNEYAKGEIIIYNGEQPSIFVIDSNGEPQKISGGNSISEDVINNIKNELHTTITNVENSILEHTINNIPLESNPILNGEDIKINGYENININNELNENVVDKDALQTAIKKVESMVFMNAQAMAASLNDINRKSIEKLNYPQKDEDNFYVLTANSLNIIEESLEDINFKFEGVIDDIVYNCEVLVNIGNVINNINLPIQYTNLPLASIKPNTKYLFKFKYNFVEILELFSI